MMINNCLIRWFLLALLPLHGCAWSNAIWLIQSDGKKTTEISLITSEQRPDPSPFALVEAKGIKTWDSPGDLIGSNIAKAKEIGADYIWCPGKEGAQYLLMPPVIPSKEQIGLLKEFLIAVTDLLKAIIALPVTVRSEAVSAQTMLCAVYRGKPTFKAP